MTHRHLHFAVPGPLDQLTGGYVYDSHMVSGLRALGWSVDAHELAGRFPDADAEAVGTLTRLLESIEDGARVVIDGLAMGGLPAPLEAHAGRLRIVSMVHHPLAEETGLSPTEAERFAESERRALATCVGVIVSSEFTAGVLERYGVAKERVRVVEPGTEPVPPATGPGPGEPPVLLSVASVTPRKGYDVLVTALAQVADLDWSCVCVGSTERDPEYADAVLRGVAHAGLDERVAFVGERHGDRLEELYRGASLFVSASHYEGYGMALAEALAHGLPVVSTTGGAIPFTVPSEAGLLVEPGDAEALADALRAVLGPDVTARETLSSAARMHARGLPDWRDSAAAFAASVVELTR